MYLLGLLFVLIIENLPFILGVIIVIFALKRVIKWLKKHPEETEKGFLD